MLERTMFGASASIPGFFGGFDPGANSNGTAVAIDSSKNVYVYNWFRSGGYRLYWGKFNNTGVQQLGKALAATVIDAYAGDMTIDSSGNVYTCGWNVYSPGTYFNPETGEWEPYYANQLIVAKYNSSGTLQWQRYYAKPPTDPPDQGNEIAKCIAVDGSGNVYVGGYTQGLPLLLKYNSSGTLQWQRKLSGSFIFSDLAVTSGGTIYAVAYNSEIGFGPIEGFYLFKIDTSGNIVWQRRLGTGTPVSTCVAINSSEDVFVGGHDTSGNGIVVKYNSSGTLQWQSRFSDVFVNYRINLDASGNIYTTGYNNGVSDPNGVVTKLGPTGTVIWQRRFKKTTLPIRERFIDVAVDNAGAIYICGSFRPVNYEGCCFLKLPDDGSKTGSYVLFGETYTYSVINPSQPATSYTTSTPTFTFSSPAYNSAASSLADQTFLLGNEVVQI